MEKPSFGPLLLAIRNGYARRYGETHGGIRDKRVPLPTAALMRMVSAGMVTTDPALRRRMAGLGLSALTFCRPGGGANPRLMDVTLGTSHLLIQVLNYKHGARANRQRLVVRVTRRPVPARDSAYDLVRGHVAAMQLTGARPDKFLLTPVGDYTPLPTEVATAWMREGIAMLGSPTPAGCNVQQPLPAVVPRLKRPRHWGGAESHRDAHGHEEQRHNDGHCGIRRRPDAPQRRPPGNIRPLPGFTAVDGAISIWWHLHDRPKRGMTE